MTGSGKKTRKIKRKKLKRTSVLKSRRKWLLSIMLSKMRKRNVKDRKRSKRSRKSSKSAKTCGKMIKMLLQLRIS